MTRFIHHQGYCEEGFRMKLKHKQAQIETTVKIVELLHPHRAELNVVLNSAASVLGTAILWYAGGDAGKAVGLLEKAVEGIAKTIKQELIAPEKGKTQ